MPVSHKDYSAELADAYPDRGHPLADPQPGFDQNGGFLPPIEIGDVGYIQHNHGYFVRLFNVHLRPGRDGQPHRVGLPEGFVELALGELRRVKNNTRLFKSSSVTCTGVDAGASGPLVAPVGGNLTFSASQERGAILVTPGPEPITSIDVLSEDIKRYKRYAVTHMNNWIPFFKAKGLKLEDVILVTGLDRTASWATAAFSGSKLDVGFGLNVQYAAVGGAHFTTQLTWHQDNAVMTNSTPKATGQEGQNTELNQTVFIRRLRAKRRFWGVAMKANAEPRDPDVGDDSDDDLAMQESPERGEFVDSLTPVLHYILAHSDARVALAHDEDIPAYVDILRRGEHQSLNPIDISMDGVGMLGSDAGSDKERVSQSSRESLQQSEPSAYTATKETPIPDDGIRHMKPSDLPHSGSLKVATPGTLAGTISTPRRSGNPPPVGRAVYFLNAKGVKQRGKVHAHGAQPDGTPVVSVKVEETGSIVNLPYDQVHLV